MKTSLRTLTDLAGFAVLLGVAWVARWTPGDLAWGLWTAGFVVLMTWLVIMPVFQVRQDGAALLKTGGLLLAVGLTGWAFTWVYGFYGEMLDLGFPLVPDPGRVYEGGTTWRNVRPFEFWPTLTEGLRQFYVVVLLALLPLAAGVRRCWPDAEKFRRDPGLNAASFARMHFTVMVLILLQIVFRTRPGRHLFVFSAAILLINYFPWHVLGGRPTAAKTEPDPA